MSRHATWKQRGSSQRGEFTKNHESEPDVTLNNVTIGQESPSGKAIRVTVKDQPAPIWMPLSQIKSMVRAGPGIACKDTMVITAWIAKEKGLA